MCSLYAYTKTKISYLGKKFITFITSLKSLDFYLLQGLLHDYYTHQKFITRLKLQEKSREKREDRLAELSRFIPAIKRGSAPTSWIYFRL